MADPPCQRQEGREMSKPAMHDCGWRALPRQSPVQQSDMTGKTGSDVNRLFVVLYSILSKKRRKIRGCKNTYKKHTRCIASEIPYQMLGHLNQFPSVRSATLPPTRAMHDAQDHSLALRSMTSQSRPARAEHRTTLYSTSRTCNLDSRLHTTTSKLLPYQ